MTAESTGIGPDRMPQPLAARLGLEKGGETVETSRRADERQRVERPGTEQGERFGGGRHMRHIDSLAKRSEPRFPQRLSQRAHFLTDQHRAVDAPEEIALILPMIFAAKKAVTICRFVIFDTRKMSGCNFVAAERLREFV